MPSPETVRVCTPRLALGAKNAKIGAGRWKNLPIRAKNPKIGAAAQKLRTTLRKFPQSSTNFLPILPR